MKKHLISSTIYEYSEDELSSIDRQLIDAARQATERSYAPYSHFHVGAALLLENGEIITGCNQENAAFPVTICAERNALFTAGNLYPDVKIEAIAIAARNAQGFLSHPISPCGSCRQVMIETETRHQHPLRIVLYGTEGIYVLEGIATLMPLSFNNME
ncbi:MAG: cytidine deaminase [Prevotella sp.]|nr:cytidine deaminase [Prevotella sp.]MCI5855115.1 cytidine deaminase [Prevotella sp.]MDD6737396.1 cytidine deaminase [Prevotella sp.]MDY6092808.1 cytidine deaminase [Prevotella sp.]